MKGNIVRSLIPKSSCLILGLIFSLSMIKNSHSQEGFLYLINPLDESVLPGEKNWSLGNKYIDSLFEYFKTTSYSLSFPNAKNKQLASTYEVHASGEVDELMKALSKFGLFEEIVKQPFIETACPNPVPFHDPFYLNGMPYGKHQLNLIEASCAWSITDGNPNILIGIIDTEFRTDHEDFSGKFAYIWNPEGAVVEEGCYHGTAVSSAASANVNNLIGIAGIGNKCKIAGYVVPSEYSPPTTDTTPGKCSSSSIMSQHLGSAIWQAYQDGVKVINVSWGGVGILGPNLINAITEITEGGSTIVTAAGNEPQITWHSTYADIPGVINVSGVNHEDKIGPTNLARNQWVDICTPGGECLLARGNTVDSYSVSRSTSASAPFVSGTVGLMLSINPCLLPAQIEAIIKATADPVSDGHLYPGKHGAGRLNAYRAVEAAQQMYKASDFDLFIQDTESDFGRENSLTSIPYWNSESIWIRNQDDSVEVHENLIYDASDPTAYVYIRVRNIGCLSSFGTNRLQLYWAKASTDLRWPAPWDGTTPPNPAMGGFVGEALIPPIPAGGEAIVKVEWDNVPDPSSFPNNFSPFQTISVNGYAHFCLLARIESTEDTMYHELTNNHPFSLGSNVTKNNNIAQRNISIIDYSTNGLGVLNDHAIVGIGNTFGNVDGIFEVELQIPSTEAGNTILDDAEVKLVLDNITWNKWIAGGSQAVGLTVYDEAAYELLVTAPVAKLKNLTFSAGQYSEVAVKANFLTEQYSGKREYHYDLVLNGLGEQGIGGERFVFIRPERKESELFFADVPASGIMNFAQGNAYIIQAEDINEPAHYRWLTEDTLTTIDSGAVVYWDSTQVQQGALLEVTSTIDGYKDYYAFSVNATTSSNVSPHYISSIAPNPANNQATVNYHIASAASVQSAKLRLTSVNNPQNVQDFTANPASGNYLIQLGTLPTGVYIVSLYCDNQLYDSKALTVQ